MTRITLDDFPGAPHGSWISEDGWLIVEEEGWTASEWSLRQGTGPKGTPIRYDDDTHRRQREAQRRYRARRAA